MSFLFNDFTNDEKLQVFISNKFLWSFEFDITEIYLKVHVCICNNWPFTKEFLVSN